MLSFIYTILILPIMLLHKSMEMIKAEDNKHEEGMVRVNQKYPPLYQDGKVTSITFYG
jgi:hypothetical protein